MEDEDMMRAYTDSDFVFGASGRPADDGVSMTLEPATGAVSLDTALYEDIVAIVGIFNNVAGAKSASVQFYESAAASGDISATWTAVGAAVVVDLGSGTAGSVGKAVKNRMEFTKKYASAIAAVTHVDPGAAVTSTIQLLLEGRIKARVS